MRFGRLDLNLLVALEALLRERSVSLAAERICLSQSATSSALSRLRDYFGDELLVTKGRQMVLTPRAEGLIEPVRAVLEQIRATIAVAPAFDPATSDRTITVMASDYATAVLLAPAMQAFTVSAPSMRFVITPLSEMLVESLERGTMDLLVTIDYAIAPDHPSLPLFDDDYVLVGWDGSALLKQPMTLDLYLALEHVTARFGRTRVPAFEDWYVSNEGLPRRVVIAAHSFLSVPVLLIGTDRIATMHRRLVGSLASYLPLKVMELPFSIPSIRQAVQWHSSSQSDPAIAWLVGELQRIAHSDPLHGVAAESDDIQAARRALGDKFRASVLGLNRL